MIVIVLCGRKHFNACMHCMHKVENMFLTRLDGWKQISLPISKSLFNVHHKCMFGRRGCMFGHTFVVYPWDQNAILQLNAILQFCLVLYLPLPSIVAVLVASFVFLSFVFCIYLCLQPIVYCPFSTPCFALYCLVLVMSVSVQFTICVFVICFLSSFALCFLYFLRQHQCHHSLLNGLFLLQRETQCR